MGGDALHESQLRGKQLVFLFMSATVAAVVVFLCGVMVGRGVNAQRAESSAALSTAETDPTVPLETPASSPASAPEGASASSQESLSYPDRLSDAALPRETLKELRSLPAPEPRASAPPPAAEPRAAADVKARREWTVQVAAVKESAEAERMARRLTAKGYAAYVNPPSAGAPRMFRVRVGTFEDRRAAESIAARLEKEEHFKPWITR